MAAAKKAETVASDCIGCGDTPPAPGTVIARRTLSIKAKVLVLVPENAADGAYEAVVQKAITDTLSVGGGLVQSVSSKTKRV